MTTHVIELNRREFLNRLDSGLDIYVRAMQYPHGTGFHRAPSWTEHANLPGFRAFGAFDDDHLVGIAYGYRGAPGRWWHEQVLSALRRQCATKREALTTIAGNLTNYFELTELHVDPAFQGHRLGERLVAHLVDGLDESRVLLSTPEVNHEANRAWRLYRRLGFTDVVRDFQFAGDSRPFAVLGADLPLAAATTDTATAAANP